MISYNNGLDDILSAMQKRRSRPSEARDIELLIEEGSSLKQVQHVDIFSMTQTLTLNV